MEFLSRWSPVFEGKGPVTVPEMLSICFPSVGSQFGMNPLVAPLMEHSFSG